MTDAASTLHRLRELERYATAGGAPDAFLEAAMGELVEWLIELQRQKVEQALTQEILLAAASMAHLRRGERMAALERRFDLSRATIYRRLSQARETKSRYGPERSIHTEDSMAIPRVTPAGPKLLNLKGSSISIGQTPAALPVIDNRKPSMPDIAVPRASGSMADGETAGSYRPMIPPAVPEPDAQKVGVDLAIEAMDK